MVPGTGRDRNATTVRMRYGRGGSIRLDRRPRKVSRAEWGLWIPPPPMCPSSSDDDASNSEDEALPLERPPGESRIDPYSSSASRYRHDAWRSVDERWRYDDDAGYALPFVGADDMPNRLIVDDFEMK